MKHSLLFVIFSLYFVQLTAMNDIPDQLFCNDEEKIYDITFSKKDQDGTMSLFIIKTCEEYSFTGDEITVSNNNISASKKNNNETITLTLVLPPITNHLAHFDVNFNLARSLKNDPNKTHPTVTKLLCSKFLY